MCALPTRSPYTGRIVTLATKHGKGKIVSRVFYAAMGAMVRVPPALDTDLFGTFTGEVPRPGPPRQTAVKKARLGMQIAGEPLGTASEGSFGPHPHFPWISSDHELVVFLDDELGMELSESFFTTDTNFGHCSVANSQVMESFLERALFPSHALIVRPNDSFCPKTILKGITDPAALQTAILKSASLSGDGRAHVETDMRAHLNPTRQKAIRRVTFRLARRIVSPCPACAAPGWGREDVTPGLPCVECGSSTDLVRFEVFRCWRCSHSAELERSDGRCYAEARDCPRCNP